MTGSMIYPDQKIHELIAEKAVLRKALEDIASAHMTHSKYQLYDFIAQLKEIASEALKGQSK